MGYKRNPRFLANKIVIYRKRCKITPALIETRIFCVKSRGLRWPAIANLPEIVKTAKDIDEIISPATWPQHCSNSEF